MQEEVGARRAGLVFDVGVVLLNAAALVAAARFDASAAPEVNHFTVAYGVVRAQGPELVVAGARTVLVVLGVLAVVGVGLRARFVAVARVWLCVTAVLLGLLWVLERHALCDPLRVCPAGCEGPPPRDFPSACLHVWTRPDGAREPVR